MPRKIVTKLILIGSMVLALGCLTHAATYQDALNLYYQGRYAESQEVLETVEHPNKQLLTSLIQLRQNEIELSRRTFKIANVPKIGPFEKVLRFWFSDTENITTYQREADSLKSAETASFHEAAKLDLAKALLAANRFDDARHIVQDLSDATTPSARRDARRLAVEIAIKTRNRSDAENEYRKLLTEFSSGDPGYELLIRMNAAFGTGYAVIDIFKTQSQKMNFVRELFKRKSYYDFEVMSDAYLKRYPGTSDAVEIMVDRGIVAFDTSNYKKSVEIMTSVRSEYPNSKWSGTAQYYLARALHRSKEYDKAGTAYITYLSSYADKDFSPAAYYYLYWIFQETGRASDYEPFLKEFKVKYGNTLFYDKLMWEYGWNAYLKQDYRTAYDILDRSDWKFDPDIKAKIGFWLAKIAGQFDAGLSRRLSQRVIQEHPFTYYGYRVAKQMFPEQADALAARFKPSGLEVDPLYETLLEAGLGDMAVTELDYRLRRLNDRNTKTVYTMAYLYSGMMQNHRAISLLTSFGFGLNPKEPHISREVAQLLYPRPYWHLIQKYSAEFNVDPYLVVALMREESLFNVRARSRTGAMGLMQIMPSTGRGVAKSLKMDWIGDEVLYLPEVNVRIGVCYIAGLNQRFNGNPILVLSGYNAGPNATKKWLERHGTSGDMDLFVANIPYSETHYYVTRVIKSYWIYRLLYDPKALSEQQKKIDLVKAG